MVATPKTKQIYNQKIIVLPTAGTQVNIHRGTGADNSTDIYLNFDLNSRKIVFSANVGFLITEIGGYVLDYPIKVHADKPFIDSKLAHNMGPFKIHTLASTTYIRAIVGGYG